MWSRITSYYTTRPFTSTYRIFNNPPWSFPLLALHSCLCFYNTWFIPPVCIKAFSSCGIGVTINCIVTTNWDTLQSLKSLQNDCQALPSQMPYFPSYKWSYWSNGGRQGHKWFIYIRWSHVAYRRVFNLNGRGCELFRNVVSFSLEKHVCWHLSAESESGRIA